MTRLFFIFLITFLSVLSLNNMQAQDNATTIIADLSAKLKASKAIKSNFVMLYNTAKGTTKSTMQGSFVFKSNKYIIDMTSHKIYNNGVDVYTYLVNAEEVQVSKYNPASDVISPASLFSGNFVNDYTFKYLGEKSIGGKKVHQIELNPKKANKSYTRMELFVDAASSEISGGNVYEKGGNFYSISISGLNMKANVSDADFTLDTKKLKDVEVVYLK